MRALVMALAGSLLLGQGVAQAQFVPGYSNPAETPPPKPSKPPKPAPKPPQKPADHAPAG